jgi:hypothetical protein
VPEPTSNFQLSQSRSWLTSTILALELIAARKRKAALPQGDVAARQ